MVLTYVWIVVVHLAGVSDRALLWLPGHLDWFAVGMALASPSLPAVLRRMAAWPGTCWAAAGVLLWLPQAELYATWDDDHRTLWAFPGVECSRIAADPVRHLNACWEPGLAGAEQLRLWESCEWHA